MFFISRMRCSGIYTFWPVTGFSCPSFPALIVLIVFRFLFILTCSISLFIAPVAGLILFLAVLVEMDLHFSRQLSAISRNLTIRSDLKMDF